MEEDNNGFILSDENIATTSDSIQGDTARHTKSNPASQGSIGVVQQTTQNQTRSQTVTSNDSQTVNISDKKAPIIMLFGPPASGKSMALVRLARYLRNYSYTISPDTLFKSGDVYKERCRQFAEDLNTNTALSSTGLNEFLMIKVGKSGKTICQILEAPGEDYFNPSSASSRTKQGFRAYLNRIKAEPNRKIWIFITEAEWSPATTDGQPAHMVKNDYVNRIAECKREFILSKDQVIILFNQIDKKHHLYVSGGKILDTAAKQALQEEYPGLSQIFKNPNPITKYWRPYNYTFVPFSTGTYNEADDSTTILYTQSDDRYPHRLWNAIMKLIKG